MIKVLGSVTAWPWLHGSRSITRSSDEFREVMFLLSFSLTCFGSHVHTQVVDLLSVPDPCLTGCLPSVFFGDGFARIRYHDSVGRDESKLTVLNIAEAEFMKLVHK